MATVQVEKQLGPARRVIAAGLTAYNRAKVGDGKTKAFAVSVRDGGVIKGGATARFWHGWVYVDLLWIDDSLRGQDLGTEVMAAVEAHALKLGARGVHLNTHGWQARPFYERCGYSVIAEIPDYPTGHACCILMKRF
ncbi:MAG: GNAT family N-acetyltransferase [Hyphomicrobiales bacterium]|nr:GNAT family N-acetyltransferase [Hyphomicrobiales bacterium]